MKHTDYLLSWMNKTKQRYTIIQLWHHHTHALSEKKQHWTCIFFVLHVRYIHANIKREVRLTMKNGFWFVCTLGRNMDSEIVMNDAAKFLSSYLYRASSVEFSMPLPRVVTVCVWKNRAVPSVYACTGCRLPLWWRMNLPYGSMVVIYA